MCRFGISIALLVLYFLTIAYLCVLIRQTDPVVFLQQQHQQQQQQLKFSSAEENSHFDRLQILALTLLLWWTLFWKILLIWILQFSPYIQKSSMFLLQQMILIEVASFTFAILVTFLAPSGVDKPNNLLQAYFELLVAFLYGFGFYQHLLFTMYVGIRYYLT